MELFRVAVKSGIIYFATPKDIRVTVRYVVYYESMNRKLI
jgi:hypothetical protein